MKKKKYNTKSYLLMSVIFGVLFGVFLVAYLIAARKSIMLQRKLDALDKIEAPYYEKSVLEVPKTDTKTETNKRVKIPIIMYHYVEYVKDTNDLIRKRLDIIPSVFEDHLRTLKNAHYETYFVRDVPAILEGSIHYSTQSAILSFDDGYEDFYTEVFPLLKKYNMRATLYVIYDYIGRKGFLNEEEIRELIDSDLVEIGSHTLDHTYLKLAPKMFADKQIIESKQKFEALFGIKMKTFAYPYGAFNNDNIEAVKKAGYVAAASVISGTMQSKDNLFYLYRIRPELFTPRTMIEVIEKLNK